MAPTACASRRARGEQDNRYKNFILAPGWPRSAAKDYRSSQTGSRRAILPFPCAALCRRK